VPPLNSIFPFGVRADFRFGFQPVGMSNPHQLSSYNPHETLTGGSVPRWRFDGGTGSWSATTLPPTPGRTIRAGCRPGSTNWQGTSPKRKNVAAAGPDKVKELEAQWDRWNTTLLRAGMSHHVTLSRYPYPKRGWIFELYIDGRPS
jgi:hypothetical protein